MNTEAIIASLDAGAVLSHFGIDHDGCGEVRLRECPTCGHKSKRDTASVNVDTGLGRCFRCGDKFNAFGLVARLAGLDAKRDHVRVLEIAAEISGLVNAEDPDVLRKIAERRAAVEERRRVAAIERAEARAAMPATWATMPERSLSGERYLKDRGLDPIRLRHSVRYLKGYAPALPLRDLVTGDVVGVQSRTPGPGEPKAPMLSGSQAKGSALWGRPSDVDPDGVDVAVIVEGITDCLAALLAFPACAIYGAAGFEHLPGIAAAVAPRVAAARGWLLIIADDDEQGASGAADAVRAAVAAGLRLADAGAGLNESSTVRLVDLGAHHDLAAAWAAGWRWEWPKNV